MTAPPWTLFTVTACCVKPKCKNLPYKPYAQSSPRRAVSPIVLPCSPAEEIQVIDSLSAMWPSVRTSNRSVHLGLKADDRLDPVCLCSWIDNAMASQTTAVATQRRVYSTRLQNFLCQKRGRRARITLTKKTKHYRRKRGEGTDRCGNSPPPARTLRKKHGSDGSEGGDESISLARKYDRQ